MKAFVRLLSLCAAIALPVAAQAAHPFAGFFYASNGSTVDQFTTAGDYVRTIARADASGEPRGLAKGPGGMYLVRSNFDLSSTVQVVDAHNAVVKTYTFGGWTGGMATSGNVRFSPSKRHFYVAAQDGVYRFSTSGTAGKLFVTQGWPSICDVAVMPNGELLVAGEYSLGHYTAQGDKLGEFSNIEDPYHLLPPYSSLIYVRGVAFDSGTNTTFVTMLNYGDYEYQLLAFDGTSNVLKGRSTFWYGSELAVTAEGTLLVGSWTQAPGIFNFSNTAPMTFTQVGSLAASDAAFVTATPPAKP